MLTQLNRDAIRELLIKLDEEYIDAQILLQERPLRAAADISRHIYEYKKNNNIPQNITYMAPGEHGIIALNSPEYELVRDWYIQKYGDIFSLLDYEKFPYIVDKEVWQVTINKLRETPSEVPIDDIIHNIPETVLKKIRTNYSQYVFYWSDINDISFGFKKIYPTLTETHEQQMFTACNEYLRSTSELFFAIPRNKSTPHIATLTAEMAFKAYFLKTNAFTPDKLKKKFRHEIQELFNSYIQINPNCEMLRINGYLNKFSNINDRYAPAALPIEDLWTVYRVMIFIVASIIRNLSGQTCRGKIEKEYPTFLAHEF